MSVGSKAGAMPKGKRQASQKPRNVCVVSEVEFGSTATGDHGSVTYALAQHLAGTGDTVTLLWAPSPLGSQPDDQEIARLGKWCFDNFLVRLELLPPSPELLRGLESSDQNSVAVYHYLKQNAFDVVYFALEGGLAHFPALAKRTGVFPDPPAIVVLAHEPLAWKLEANSRAVERKEQMTVAHMEKTSAETCDHLVVTKKKPVTATELSFTQTFPKIDSDRPTRRCEVWKHEIVANHDRRDHKHSTRQDRPAQFQLQRSASAS